MIKMPGLMLIDDTPAELEEIQNALNIVGIPCLPVLFNREDKASGLEHVEFGNFEPRIIITDLNLRDSTSSSASDFYPTIASMLARINPQSPYVIFFWSKRDDSVEEVMGSVCKALKGQVLLPMGFSTLKKSEFSGAENSAALREKIKSLLDDIPYFSALFGWETRVANAAQETTTTLLRLAASQVESDIEGLDYLSDHLKCLDTIVSAIGNEAFGRKNAEEAQNAAIDFGLMPVLQDRLHAMSVAHGQWNRAIKCIGKPLNLSPNVVASLNTFYHTSSLSTDMNKSHKGVVVELNSELLDEGDAQRKVESKLGVTLEELIHEEFLSKNRLGQDKPASNAFQLEARNNITLCFLELSADCDQAQRKVKLHRYVLCALIPEKYSDLAESHGTTDRPRKTAHDGIYRAPDILINDERYLLKVSFKYQIGTKPSSKVNGIDYDNRWLGEPILRLREQILADISFRCAQYSTRPGIISFR